MAGTALNTLSINEWHWTQPLRRCKGPASTLAATEVKDMH